MNGLTEKKLFWETHATAGIQKQKNVISRHIDDFPV